MKINLFNLIFTSFIVLISCSDREFNEKEKEADNLINTFIEKNKIPGLSVTILNEGGNIEYSKGFGYADIEQKININPKNSIFRIGSFSKTLAGTALMKMYEENKIEIDSSVGLYIKDLPADKKNITLRQIAGHMSGIRHYRDGDDMNLNLNYENTFDALNIFINDSLLFDPGTKYSYSTHAWTLLSLAMEKAYGENFIELMKNEILNPLQLDKTFAEEIDLKLKEKVSFYEKNDFGDIALCPNVNNSWKWAGGGYVSTTQDIANFTWKVLYTDFLLPETVKEMTNSQKLPNDEKTNYGIGWRIRYDDKDNQYLGHTGGSVGGTTFVFSSKDSLVVSIMANMSKASFGKLPYELINIFKN